MRIPEVREELLVIANHIFGERPTSANRLRELAEELKRRPRKVGKPKAVFDPMTDEKRETIRKLAAMYPHWTMVEIAKRVNVNQARVSETLSGFRE